MELIEVDQYNDGIVALTEEEDYLDYLKRLDSESGWEKMQTATRMALSRKDLSYLRIMGVKEDDKFYKSVKNRIFKERKGEIKARFDMEKHMACIQRRE